jgi:hypothetical protein
LRQQGGLRFASGTKSALTRIKERRKVSPQGNVKGQFDQENKYLSKREWQGPLIMPGFS